MCTGAMCTGARCSAESAERRPPVPKTAEGGGQREKLATESTERTEGFWQRAKRCFPSTQFIPELLNP